MPTTYPNIGLTLPTRGAGGAGAWGDTLDADLALLDAHDHQSGRGARITPAAISINADLPFSSLWAPTQLHRVQFSNIAASTLTGGMVKSLFVSDGTGGLVNQELYWRTNAGASVQITAGSALNVGAFVGGLTGDYTSVGAQLEYNDAGKAYHCHEGTGDSNQWARVKCGGLRLSEFNTNEAAFVAQIAPAALGASYTTTWPTALPGSTVLQQIDSTGQMIWSNTVPNAVTFSAGITVSASGAAITGNSTVTGNLNVTGTMTFGRTDTYSMAFAILAGGSALTAGGIGGGSQPTAALGTATDGAANCPLRLHVGATITSWQVRLIKNTNNTKTVSANLCRGNTGGASVTRIGSIQSNSGNAPGLITLTESSLSEVVAVNTSYFIEIVGSGTSGDSGLDYQITTA